jgi:hypothetical protein
MKPGDFKVLALGKRSPKLPLLPLECKPSAADFCETLHSSARTTLVGEARKR